MTAKGHITLQKYCFYVSWQNLDLNFQPCRLQNSNKINRRFVRPKRRFGKMKRRLESVQTPFYFEGYSSVFIPGKKRLRFLCRVCRKEGKSTNYCMINFSSTLPLTVLIFTMYVPELNPRVSITPSKVFTLCSLTTRPDISTI